MPKLVAITKDLPGAFHELGEKWITVGRHDGNDFQIRHISVSGRHCEVRWRDGELAVRDLLSTNGTFVDDRKIIEGVLTPGQILRLGEVELRLDLSAAPEVPGAAFMSTRLLTKSAAKPTAAASPVPQPDKASEIKPAAPPAGGDLPAKRHHVLFVDDSLAFLESFTALCSSLSNHSWIIHTAISADRALFLLQQHPIDLVVLDIGIPMVDGIQLLGIIGRRYPGLKIVVLTGKASDSNRATCLAGGAELFIEKPVTTEGTRVVFNMLNDLVSWTHHEGFSGALRQVGLPEVIQMECNARHSTILEVRNHQMLGQIYIEAGAITHAVVGTWTGEKAFNRLLSLKGGEFHLKSFSAPPQRTVQAGWEALLLEAARCNDEETSLITKQAAASSAPPATNPLPATPENPPAAEDEIVVVATYDGKWHPVGGAKK